MFIHEVIYQLLVISFMAVIGLCGGSFASAIAHRISIGEGWRFSKKSVAGKKIFARSACSDCGHQLTVIDLFPVLSWVLTGGKCRYCSKKISVKYPFIELFGAGLAIVFYLFSGEITNSSILYLITLPFFLVFSLLLFSRSKSFAKIPLYIFVMTLLNILLFLFTIMRNIDNFR